MQHLQTVAERADRRSASGLLLVRQAYYLLSFDTSPTTGSWLRDMNERDRRLVAPRPGWSGSWALARSTASALTRLGDPEPMEFLAEQLNDKAGDVANLNYWTFWSGDLPGRQTTDAFINSTSAHPWHGSRLLHHVVDRDGTQRTRRVAPRVAAAARE